MHIIGKILKKKEWQQWNIDAEKIIVHPRYDVTGKSNRPWADGGPHAPPH
jgi:hypothetical protein